MRPRPGFGNLSTPSPLVLALTALGGMLTACTGNPFPDAIDAPVDARDAHGDLGSTDAVDRPAPFDVYSPDAPPPSCTADAGRTVDAGAPPSAVVQLALGGRHTCARLADGTVRCWGSNAMGQLGDGTTADRSQPVPVVGLADAIDLAAGGQHTCAVRADGHVVCWGDDDDGQLGDGALTARAMPWPVSGIDRVLRLALGKNTSCALNRDAMVLCWGRNGELQFGNGTNNDSNVPVPSSSLLDVQSLALGAFHGCAVLTDRTLRCWGSNFEGQIGDCSSNDRAAAVPIAMLPVVTQVSLGEQHSCALAGDGVVSCWGNNFHRQLGFEPAIAHCPNSSTPMNAFAPTPVPGVTGIAQIALGGYHSCAVRTTGTVLCFGANLYGQAGLCTGADVTMAAEVPGLAGIVQLAAGQYHACALGRDGVVSCWGDNEDGRLGDGTLVTRSFSAPVRW